jgi:hypothetical protein
MEWRAGLIAMAAMAAMAAPGVAAAQVPGEIPPPIPQDPLAVNVPTFTGQAATPDPVKGQRVPRHPFMAPNGRSNLHDDAYQTDTYSRIGPLGDNVTTGSALFARECGSITFDSHGRLVTVCVGLDKPVLTMLDPNTLKVLATMDLPPRPVSANPFQDFSGGGYFYLDNRDRAVISAANRHILVIGETGGTASPGFAVRHDYDLSSTVKQGDALISALPDWHGRIWFASKHGVVGIVTPGSGKVTSTDTGEPIGNSFAVSQAGGVFIVTDKAMYRFEARRGRPTVTWRRIYPNIGIEKPGQTEKGSGTTPTLIGHRYVAITDNADPMDVIIFRRTPKVPGGSVKGRRGDRRLVCKQPVFKKGASDTDQSLIVTRRSMIVENNYGYTGPAATMNGGVTSPGIERVDLDRGGRGCHTVWTSQVRAPSVVPKLSLHAGLVYTYTKPKRDDLIDAWYLTALDFRTGETVYSRLAGAGAGFNNNYAPVTLGPHGIAYVGALVGLTMFRDGPI